MEHVLIRNAKLNYADRIRLSNGAFTQTRVGAPPFKLDRSGLPERVKKGDRVYVAQAGYGVVGTVIVADIPPASVIPDHAAVGVLKAEYRRLEASYWEHLRDSLDRATRNGKPLWFQAITSTLESAYPESAHFPLSRPAGSQSSWIYLSSEAIRDSLFAHRGRSVRDVSSGYDDSKYGTIPDKVRWAVTQIWRDEWWGDRKDGEALHFDHFVPQAAGGPGCFPENVIPMPASMNLTKQHGIVRALPVVAVRWGILPASALALWHDVLPTRQRRQDRLEVGRKVTAAVRSLGEQRQRRFYFEVLVEGVGSRVEQLFVAHGMYNEQSGSGAT